ncbi:MAG: GTP-binding protein [Candidatus Korarchaeota archaeon]|nr:GTP-binding protein [Candidatus Korarchaeota archaeon]NIU84571.1 GTP-binding protein [Candidatus Thorarchaeota archaeon]NIW14629.1 GTP-binding protein [Candidatus Thorarchaeota archaeon]NIW52706.1 GTP-binding protein [Candidatus Korarchaeota archaeon]
MKKEEEKPLRSIRTKIITIGDGGVGKTSSVRRYLGWGFKERYLPTIGANFYTKESEYSLEDGPLSVEWTVWDISGQPAFKEVRDKYYLGARGALVVFDITRKKTAENTKKWVEELYDKTGDHQPFVLLGNKVDLRGTEREAVPPSIGERIAKELSEKYGWEVPYLETSAKTKKNLDKAFKLLAVKIAAELGEI